LFSFGFVKVKSNPTNSCFSIKGIEQGTAAVYSISGKMIMQQAFDAQTQFNLSEMEPGIYLVQVEGKGLVYISKLY
jgi:hypothetical protein